MEKSNGLAKIGLAINIVLIVLVIILFTRGNGSSEVTTDNNETDNAKTEVVNTASQPAAASPQLAFYHLDSLQAKLKLYTQIEKEIKIAADELEAKMKRKQREIEAWTKKWQDKGKLLSTEEQKYMQEAQKMEAEARNFEQQIQYEFAEKQNELTQTFFLRISNTVSDYAKTKGYSAVFPYQFGQSVTYYDSGMDITNDLIEIMNKDFDEDNVTANSDDQ